MLIRRARADEAAGLSRLALRSKRSWGYPESALAAWRPILEVEPQEVLDHPAFVGEEAGQIVGFYLLLDHGTQWQLDHLWVEPEFMRRGHGRELMRHAIRTATEGGALRILIDADPNAERFYLPFGARRAGMVPAPIEGQPDRLRPQLVVDRAPPQ